MAKVFFSQPLNLSIDGEIWSAQNGATRRSLKVINKIKLDKTEMVECQLGFLDKGNHSFIFINEPKPNDNRILGIFLNNTYSYEVVEGEELFSNTSNGGYGNSCSKFGVYEVETLLKCYTYKNRKSPTYYKLNINGWEKIENYVIEQSEMTEI